MKVITIEQFEADFEAIIDDIEHNKEYYRIQTEKGDLMMVPFNEYEVLKDTYQDWVQDPQIDPYPLPVEYVADAEPKDL